MKKVLLLALAMIMACCLVACSGNNQPTQEPSTEVADTVTDDAQKEETLEVTDLEGKRILHLISNTRGDGGNHDAAARAIENIRDTYGAEIKIVEMGNTPADVTKYLPTTLDACEENWDYIVCGTPQMIEPVMKASDEFPEQKFIIYDAEFTRENEGDYPNVYSSLFKQNEAAFLAGAMAAAMSDTGKIGFIGGVEIPTINDFLVGYIDGARYINPEINVLSAFVGSWNDLAKAKEIANTQYQQGASLIFPAAGQAFSGVFDAGYEAKKMYLGCDVDRSVAYEQTNADMNNYMPTSVVKYVDKSVENAFARILAGENIFGKHETVGLKEDCVGISKNSYYETLVPEEVRQQVEQIEQDIISGKIEVKSAFGMTQEELNAFKNN